MQAGFWYGDKNADGSRILEFTDAIEVLIIIQYSVLVVRSGYTRNVVI